MEPRGRVAYPMGPPRGWLPGALALIGPQERGARSFVSCLWCYFAPQSFPPTTTHDRMQPRATRYWLRFDSGPRQGETVPLPEGTLSVGRRSANKIVLADGSISGFHAELYVDVDSIEVADLESTNGVRVGSSKVNRAPLAHGDSVTFGSIAATVMDQQFVDSLGGEVQEPRSGPVITGGTGQMDRVGERELAAVKKRGVLAPVLLVLALGGGAAALYFLGGKGDANTGPEPVADVPGNLITDASFEGDGALAWETSEGSTGAFGAGLPFAHSGGFGLGVFLDAAEPAEGAGAAGPVWSYSSGPLVNVSSGRGLDLTAQMQTGDGAVGRLGLAFENSRGEASPFVAWSRGLDPTEEFTALSLVATVPPGYDRVAVAVAAQGPGWVSLDDVVLLGTSAPSPLATSESLVAHGYGDDGATLTLVRSGRTLFPSIGFGNWGPSGTRGSSVGSWGASAAPGGLKLTPSGADRGAQMHLSVQGESGSDGEGEIFLASLGPAGYRSHGGAFELEAMADLLMGRGYDLLRLSVQEPVAAIGRVRAGVLSLTFSPGSGATAVGPLVLQTSFGEERATARQLEGDAERAEREGRPGDALSLWQRLLDEVPFEAPLATRAETERARLIQAGLESVEELRRDIERARFFGLADLFRQGHARAQKLERSFAGSEVAQEAAAVSIEVLEALAALPNGLEDNHRRRLTGVLQALEGVESPGLRDHVRQALEHLSRADLSVGDLENNHGPEGGHEGND
ncbi:MAG: hypothetical protein ACI8QS_001785 [Planctomycetota bacterium]|jgi:hypothetical protein